MIDQSTLKGRIVAAALRLAAERPWSGIALRDIAEAAGVTLADLSREFAGKTDILVAFNRMIDDEVLRAAPKPPEGQTPRDAVFEVVMARFDALSPYRSAVRAIVRDASPDGRLFGSLLRSQRWMLQAAGIDTDGFRGGVRVAGLTSVYASVFRTWLDDEDPGLARTMAALDRRLRSGERTLASVEDACGGLRRMGETARGLMGRMRQTSRSAPPGAPAGDAAPPV